MAWEECEGNIRRQEVPGGWIYKVPVGTTPGGVSEVVAALFVPEPSKVTDDYHKSFETGVKVTAINEARTDYQHGWDAGYKASKDEGASAE